MISTATTKKRRRKGSFHAKSEEVEERSVVVRKAKTRGSNKGLESSGDEGYLKRGRRGTGEGVLVQFNAAQRSTSPRRRRALIGRECQLRSGRLGRERRKMYSIMSFCIIVILFACSAQS